VAYAAAMAAGMCVEIGKDVMHGSIRVSA
jgi:hypothetical protein